MKVELIAECSTNHGGDLSLAKQFIHRFAEAGADWVKFQHTRVKHLRPNDPQYAWFQQAEFTLEQFAELKAECERAGTKFLTTVFNAQDVPEVVSLGLSAIKVGSGEAHEPSLAHALRESGIPRVIIACGLTSRADLPFAYREFGIPWRLNFLACCTCYPCPSVMAINGYGQTAPFYAGWSDHSNGIEGCQLAILNGATIIEKHVQLPQQKRPCRSFEATVEEFTQLRAFADDDPSRFIGRWQHA